MVGSLKGIIKETLVNTYNLNIDYKISKSNKEIILLTPDCFKRLCLLSKTKKGEVVRTYFIELEKLINNYKNYIIDGLKYTIKVLENNQKPIPKNIKGVVYVLKSPKDIDGIYRFGKTKDFNNRLINYNYANSDKMQVMFIFVNKNTQQIEDYVISQIKQFRYKKRKDFYQINIDIIKQLIDYKNQLTLKFKHKINKSTNTNNKIGGNSYNIFIYIHK